MNSPLALGEQRATTGMLPTIVDRCLALRPTNRNNALMRTAQSSFRISPEGKALLVRLAQQHGCSQARIVEMAIRALARVDERRGQDTADQEAR